ncbi:MAG: ECF-type sigma factor [Acidobacteriota bacterium]
MQEGRSRETSEGDLKSVTLLLRAAAEGDKDSEAQVFDILYDELRDLARRQLRRHGRQTLDTHDLVHEAYLKIGRYQALDIADRVHYLCLSARAMRQVLVDHARKKLRQKRGSGGHQETLKDNHAKVTMHFERVLAVDQALSQLGRNDSRLPSIVECKYFAGYTETETADALGLSERTVRRLWQHARRELRAALA